VKIGIVTDSSISLPENLLKQHNIHVIPILITHGEKTYRDRIDINTLKFYSLLDDKTYPKTSQPSPGEFIATYEQLKEQFQAIISIHVTAKASGTCQSALIAREHLKNQDITIVDSETTSMGLGFLTLAAAKAAQKGLSKDEILTLLEHTKQQIHQYMALPSLQYLRKSGRLHAGQSILASLLRIAPVLTMKDGILTATARLRSFQAALDHSVSLLKQDVGQDPIILGIIHANAEEKARDLATRLAKEFHTLEIIISDIGSALAVHGGPGMLGLAAWKQDDIW